MPHWTRLEGTPLWRAAERAHAEPAGRHYHGMSHVRRLYQHAEETFGFAWCPDLDRAILAHDAIFDGRPNEVRRSVSWLARVETLTQKTEDLILSTEHHQPGKDNRMILLDLADFMFPDVSYRNTDLLAQEAAALKGVSRATFAQGAVGYLQTLAETLASGMADVVSPSERDALSRICIGIDTVIERLDDEIKTFDAVNFEDLTP